jgi:hypothetical protein
MILPERPDTLPGKTAMRFSWTGLILAPLLVPVIFSATMAVLMGEDSLAAFLGMLFAGCIVSYGATIFLFLPCLFLLSLTREMTGLKVCMLGSVLGAVLILPLIVFSWGSSGPDSGPPVENFFVFLLRWAADPVMALFPLAGMVTAGLYWWLGKRRIGRSVAVQ